MAEDVAVLNITRKGAARFFKWYYLTFGLFGALLVTILSWVGVSRGELVLMGGWKDYLIVAFVGACCLWFVVDGVRSAGRYMKTGKIHIMEFMAITEIIVAVSFSISLIVIRGLEKALGVSIIDFSLPT